MINQRKTDKPHAPQQNHGVSPPDTFSSASVGKIPPKQNKQPPENGKRHLLFLGGVVVFSLLFVLFVLRPAQVYGPSMENTLQEGNLLLVWQLAYKPAVGDVVVTKKNSAFQRRLVKRVIATQGQHLIIQNGRVTLNGVVQKEPYLKEQAWESPPLNLIVPPGQVFLMGDNRNHSRDSRDIGCLPASELIGKALV